MKVYEKPVVSVDAGMAEGVYAASGSNGGVRVSEPSVTADWGNNNGQVKFALDLSGMDLSQLTVILTFNMDITGGWGGGANASVSGNKLRLEWYSAPASAEIYVQVDSGLNSLQCTGSSYSNK